MKILATTILVLVNTFAIAQVGINTSFPKSTLEFKASDNNTAPEGILTVRISGNALKSKDTYYGSDQNSDVVYVTEVPTEVSTKTSNITSPGFYYYNSTLEKWIGLHMPKFFYMPSIYFDTTTLGTYTKNLYQIYADQFSTPQVKSELAFGKIPIVGATDLEYYITTMDGNVFKDVTITKEGVMTYTIADNATDSSFLNIVFVVK